MAGRFWKSTACLSEIWIDHPATHDAVWAVGVVVVVVAVADDDVGTAAVHHNSLDPEVAAAVLDRSSQTS